MGAGPALRPLGLVGEVGIVNADTGRPILIVGAPRSGTTWVGKVLGSTAGVFYVHEPDNEGLDPRALKAKRSVGRFPVLSGSDVAPEYLALWHEVFECSPPNAKSYRWRMARKSLRAAKRRGEVEDAFRRAPREDSLRLKTAGLCAIHGAPRRPDERPVVKSVYASLAAEWISDRFSPSVLVVLRDPLNVISSPKTYLAEGSDLAAHPRVVTWIRDGVVPAPDPGLSPIGWATWQLGVFQQALQRSARDRGWPTVRHEDLCLQGSEGFEALAESLGLTWTDRAAAFLAQSNRSGTGYATKRVAEELPEIWRDRLSANQLYEIQGVLDTFPVIRGDGSANAGNSIAATKGRTGLRDPEEEQA